MTCHCIFTSCVVDIMVMLSNLKNNNNKKICVYFPVYKYQTSKNKVEIYIGEELVKISRENDFNINKVIFMDTFARKSRV